GEGTVRPVNEISLVPQVEGKIQYTSSSMVNGGEFKKGDILLRIEPLDYELAVTLTKAKVKTAESLLQLAEQESAASKEEWRLHPADGSSEDTPPPPLVAKEPQLAAAKANLAAEKAYLQKAILNLERTTLKAPFEGRVSQENVDTGQYVRPGQNLAILYSIDAAEIVLPLEEEDLSWFNVPGFTPGTGSGSSAKVTASIAGQTLLCPGEVVRAEGKLDERTRMVNVVVRVEKPYGTRPPLAVGLFVTVIIEGRILPDAAVIPRSGLRQGNVVWVVDKNDRLHFKKVELARFDGDNAILKTGLGADKAVVISPLKVVTDGMKVRVVPVPKGNES
ncbi:MAG: efflux RND transporter periplasmic adaptor subunit, partial [Deltaproteobacteria bacterium]|nr:efflux RND transporter periplasmic adaptor subunit [Deltaproteobacteria bacterium]